MILSDIKGFLIEVNSQSKRNLRERILTLLRNQKEEERLIKSLAISDRLFKMPELQAAKTVLFYASFDGEVETFEMMKKALNLGKIIGLPGIIGGQPDIVPTRVTSLEDDLQAGPYGIQQPRMDRINRIANDDIDLIVVPGIAFDRKNNRLGRGGGYYDRFLRGFSKRTFTVGLAFDFQVLDALPDVKDHDIPVDCVLSN